MTHKWILKIYIILIEKIWISYMTHKLILKKYIILIENLWNSYMTHTWILKKHIILIKKIINLIYMSHKLNQYNCPAAQNLNKLPNLWIYWLDDKNEYTTKIYKFND